MTNYNLERIEFFKIQIILTILFMGTLIISVLLTYNEKLRIEEKPLILSDEDATSLLTINRWIALLISIGFLALNIHDKKVKEEVGAPDIKFADLQIDASVLILISSIIVLYVAIYDPNHPVTQLANPQS